jgi:hypothetical protein
MNSLCTAVGTTMFQRIKVFIYFLGLYLNRRQAKALLEQIQASNLNDEARDRIIEILRLMLRLPEESLPEPSWPQPPLPARSTPSAPRPGASSIESPLMP